MLNNADDIEDMASKGVGRQWLQQRMTSTMMGADPQFDISGDQQGLERSVGQAEDCSCCKSHRRDQVYGIKICDC